MTKPAKTLEDNIGSNDEKCRKMEQLMLAEGDRAQEIRELINALRKIGYFQSFQVKDNEQFSSEKRQKTPERKLKTRRKAAYRRMKKYYKSIKQYKKERLRRKLCWLLSGKYKESEIAEMLGISRRTVIRDMNRIKPYYFRLMTSYFNKIEEDRIKEMKLKLEGKNTLEQFKILTDAMIVQHERFKTREYRRHYQIILLDLTQLDPYGIPKVTFIPRGRQTLAYPYKVRVHVKGCYEGREFTADVGGFNIVQTSRSWW